MFTFVQKTMEEDVRFPGGKRIKARLLKAVMVKTFWEVVSRERCCWEHYFWGWQFVRSRLFVLEFVFCFLFKEMERLDNDISTHRVSWYKAEKGWLIEEGLKWGGKGWNPKGRWCLPKERWECQHVHTSGDQGTERNLQHLLISKWHRQRDYKEEGFRSGNGRGGNIYLLNNIVGS